MSAQVQPQGPRKLALGDVIAEAGGKYVLLALMDEEDAFSALWRAQDRLVERNAKCGVELELLPYEEMFGYCSGLFA